MHRLSACTRAGIDDTRTRLGTKEERQELAPFILHLEPPFPVRGERFELDTCRQPQCERREDARFREHPLTLQTCRTVVHGAAKSVHADAERCFGVQC